MAALCGLGNMEGLIDRVCIKHDQQVGVYGFVFFRGMCVMGLSSQSFAI